MSDRRKVGDIVGLKKYAGFICESDKYAARIIDPQTPGWCMLDCGDKSCREWDLTTIGAETCSLYHVSECQMIDAIFSVEEMEEGACVARKDESHCSHWWEGDAPCCGCGVRFYEESSY